MKSKNAPQTMTRRLLKYVPLLIAFGVVWTWAWLVSYGMSFPSPSEKAALFYPLVRLLPDARVCAVVCCIILMFHGLAIALDANKILTALSFFAMGGFAVFCLFVGVLETAYLDDYDTAILNGHLYRLVYIPSAHWGYSYPVSAYTVLECDESGDWCGYYRTPYLKENSIPEDGRLEIDSDSRRLLLYVGLEIIDVENTDIFKICHELYKQHTDRNRNIDFQGYVCA
jgi:hypothetical protein